jgi:hypothetical protein
MSSEMVERGGRRGGEGNGLVGVEEVSSSLVYRRHADACNRDARVTTITREAGTRKCQIANNLAAQVSIAAAAQRSLISSAASPRVTSMPVGFRYAAGSGKQKRPSHNTARKEAITPQMADDGHRRCRVFHHPSRASCTYR